MVGKKEIKGQAGIIVMVLIILIVLVGVLIIWNLVNPLVLEKGEEIEIGGFTISLNVEEVVLFENGVVHVRVSRGTGGEIDGLRFVFHDEQGNARIKDEEGLEKLETKQYYFSALGEEFGEIESVSVAPIVNGKLGIESEVQTGEFFEVPAGVVRWWKSDKYDYINFDLPFDDQFAISFWANNSGSVSGTGYSVSYEDNEVSFVYGGITFISENLEPLEKNHIVVSVAPAFSKIYINKEVQTFDGIGDLSTIDKEITPEGDVEDIMVFNRALPSADGLYSHQLK